MTHVISTVQVPFPDWYLVPDWRHREGKQHLRAFQDRAVLVQLTLCSAMPSGEDSRNFSEFSKSGFKIHFLRYNHPPLQTICLTMTKYHGSPLSLEEQSFLHHWFPHPLSFIRITSCAPRSNCKSQPVQHCGQGEDRHVCSSWIRGIKGSPVLCWEGGMVTLCGEDKVILKGSNSSCLWRHWWCASKWDFFFFWLYRQINW